MGSNIARRRRLLGAVFSVALTAGCSAAPGSSYTEDTYALTRGHDKYAVVIGSGHLASNRWSPLAQVDAEGQLCLGVRWISASEPVDPGCGFGNDEIDDEGRGTEPVATSQAADGSVLAFGPSPAGAVTARLSSPAISGTGCTRSTVPPVDVPITHRLPRWYGGHGGWFTTPVPRQARDCVLDVRFLDKRDQTVPQPTNF